MAIDLSPRPAVQELTARTVDFVRTEVLPVEDAAHGAVAAAGGDDLRRRLVETLVRLHEVDPKEVDPKAVGLGDLGRPDSDAARQLRRWSRQWREMQASDPRDERLASELE